VGEKRAVCLSFKSVNKGEIGAIFTKMLRLKGYMEEGKGTGVGAINAIKI